MSNKLFSSLLTEKECGYLNKFSSVKFFPREPFFFPTVKSVKQKDKNDEKNEIEEREIKKFEKCEIPDCTNLASHHSIKIIPQGQSFAKKIKVLTHYCLNCHKKSLEVSWFET